MMDETKLNFVLFRDAIEHMSRVARCLAMQRGHFMLVGVGGSGKKSLTTMAAALSQGELATIEIRKNYGRKEWREDLFKLMKKVAMTN
jgi:dynein heavy chain, axonemal